MIKCDPELHDQLVDYRAALEKAAGVDVTMTAVVESALRSMLQKKPAKPG